jgi:hypothetical protein
LKRGCSFHLGIAENEVADTVFKAAHDVLVVHRKYGERSVAS